MAAAVIHVAQANHNRTVAQSLLTEPRHDWAITAGFYSAVHSFEALLYFKPQKHTETSIPTKPDGSQRYSRHAWREILVQQYLPEPLAKSFRKLRTASESTRYLAGP